MYKYIDTQKISNSDQDSKKLSFHDYDSEQLQWYGNEDNKERFKKAQNLLKTEWSSLVDGYDEKILNGMPYGHPEM